MTTTDDIVARHITSAQDRLDHARQQAATAPQADRAAWQMQQQSDQAGLDALLQFQAQLNERDGAEALAFAQQRREELRATAEAVDLARDSDGLTLNKPGAVAQEVLVQRAVTPFRAIAFLARDLWEAGRTAA